MHVDRCTNCPFGPGRGVGSRGNPKGKIVFLGESPGNKELVKGEPFVHDSGFLLNAASPIKVLTQYHPTTKELIYECDPEVLILNAMCCWPGDKKTPAKVLKAAQMCQSRVLAEIAQHPRDIVIALGGAAMCSATNNWTLKSTQTRGQIIPNQLAREGVACAVHPAFLLHGGGSYPQFKMDLAKFCSLVRPHEEVQAKTTKLVPTSRGISNPTYEAITDLIRANIVIDHILGTFSDVAADYETTGLNPRKDRILCLGICGDPKHVYIFTDAPGVLETTPRLLHSSKVKFIWHNGKFDVKFAWNNGAPEARVDEDTMLLNYALDENKGLHDLEQIASTRLLIEPYKFKVHDLVDFSAGETMEKVPKPILYEYLAKDCSSTKQIHPILSEEVHRDEKLSHLYRETLIKQTKHIAKIEMRGMPLNMELSLANEVKYQKIVDDLREEFFKYSPQRFAIGNALKVKWLLYEHLKVSYDKAALAGVRGKKSPEDTTKETLDKLERHPAVVAIRNYRSAQKRLSQYVIGLRKFIDPTDGRIHPDIIQHGTATGRLAMRKPPMQTIPRTPDIRGQLCSSDMHHNYRPYGLPYKRRGNFIAGVRHTYEITPGRILMQPDFNQMELRVMTVLSRDKFLTGLYQDGKRNLHKEAAKKFYGENYDNEEYTRVKGVNFGIPYGREAFSLALEYDMSVEEAQRLVDEWGAMAPQAIEYLMWCRQQPLDSMQLWTSFGRKRRFGVISYNNLDHTENQASNFGIQSMASDICGHTAMNSDDELVDLDVFIIHLVHDQIIADAPNDTRVLKTAFEILEYRKNEVIRKYLPEADIPFILEPAVGFGWGKGNEMPFNMKAAQ